MKHMNLIISRVNLNSLPTPNTSTKCHLSLQFSLPHTFKHPTGMCASANARVSWLWCGMFTQGRGPRANVPLHSWWNNYTEEQATNKWVVGDRDISIHSAISHWLHNYWRDSFGPIPQTWFMIDLLDAKCTQVFYFCCDVIMSRSEGCCCQRLWNGRTPVSLDPFCSGPL